MPPRKSRTGRRGRDSSSSSSGSSSGRSHSSSSGASSSSGSSSSSGGSSSSSSSGGDALESQQTRSVRRVTKHATPRGHQHRQLREAFYREPSDRVLNSNGKVRASMFSKFNVVFFDDNALNFKSMEKHCGSCLEVRVGVGKDPSSTKVATRKADFLKEIMASPYVSARADRAQILADTMFDKEDGYRMWHGEAGIPQTDMKWIIQNYQMFKCAFVFDFDLTLSVCHGLFDCRTYKTDKSSLLYFGRTDMPMSDRKILTRAIIRVIFGSDTRYRLMCDMFKSISRHKHFILTAQDESDHIKCLFRFVDMCEGYKSPRVTVFSRREQSKEGCDSKPQYISKLMGDMCAAK